MKITSVQTYGPENRYLRVSIPVDILEKFPVKAGSVLFWDVVDPATAVLKIVR